MIIQKKYNRTEKLLELVEDTALGYLAKERDIKNISGDYVELGQAETKLKKKETRKSIKKFSSG